ncbi:MAG: mercury(II) reductase [Thermoplasmatales archaeon]
MKQGEQDYDLAILGNGAAAFSAAIKATELSQGEMKIAMVGVGPLGGTCVNVGCVPSKYIIEASKAIFNPAHPRISGISGNRVEYNFRDLMRGLRSYISDSRKRKYEDVIESYGNVVYFEGLGRFNGNKKIGVTDKAGRRIASIRASIVLIATGSRPAIPSIKGLECSSFLTSDTIWRLDSLPLSVAVIGGGAVGLELGQALQYLGSEVTIVEKKSSVLPQTEPEIGAVLENLLKEEGIRVNLNTKIVEINETNGGRSIRFMKGGKVEKVDVEEIIVAAGRVPNTDRLSLDSVGVKIDPKGGILTSSSMETNIPGIYAAGDCVSKNIYLETLAAREGVAAVSNMFGLDTTIDYDSTPWAVFTTPQVAGVGMTEIEFLRKGGSVVSRTLKLENLIKAGITGETNGLIKLVLNAKNNKIIGLHILAPIASEIITEGAYAIKYGYTMEDIISTTHTFPSFSEGVKLAAQSFLRDITKMSCCVE